MAPRRAKPGSPASRAESASRASRASRTEPATHASTDFAARVVAWQRVQGRHDLPWQNTRDAYRIWLSEIMLQQTQVTTVIPYFQNFIATFPDVRALAAAPLDRVLASWSGLGYYRRAHHLHAAAKQVVAAHGAIFPSAPEAIGDLPGIGRSTAAAIATFAYRARAPILDGNVKRVLARHRGVAGFPGDAKVQAQLWRCAETLLPVVDLEAYAQGLMDLGAGVCTRIKPRCGECPVSADCVARRTGQVATLPSPRPKKILPQRAVQVLLIQRAGRILFEKRPPAGIWAGLWSLPEVAVGADVGAHCRRHFGITLGAIAEIAPVAHSFTHYHLTLLPRRAIVRTAAPRAEEPGVAWLAPKDAVAAALPAPIRKLVLAASID